MPREHANTVSFARCLQAHDFRIRDRQQDLAVRRLQQQTTQSRNLCLGFKKMIFLCYQRTRRFIKTLPNTHSERGGTARSWQEACIRTFPSQGQRMACGLQSCSRRQPGIHEWWHACQLCRGSTKFWTCVHLVRAKVVRTIKSTIAW